MEYFDAQLTATIFVWCILLYDETVLSIRLSPDCECGSFKNNFNRVYMGEEAQPNEYPWIAYIDFYDTEVEDNLNCGGSVISNYYVLTVAHCMINAKLESIKIFLGIHNIDTHYNRKTRIYSAARVIIHSGYDHTYDARDIALIKLRKEIMFSNIVKPICLPMREMDLSGNNLLFAGWGRTEDGVRSKVLIHTSLELLLQRQCSQAVTNFNGVFSPKWMLPIVECAYDKISIPCEGDSGGPLMDTIKGQPRVMVLRGLLSFGSACPKNSRISIKKVNVFTKITAFIEWIDRHTRDSIYCSKPL